MKERRRDYRRKNLVFLAGTIMMCIVGLSLLWVASLRIPDLSDLSERRIAQSTKIYDRTGEILLYDMSRDVRRTVVPFEAISPNIKKATLAIEDKTFYSHKGIEPISIFRATIVNVGTLSFSQGGSTITQQVVKNAILTNDKTPTRKLKEWILAVKLEKVLTKDQILAVYLNEIPFGGNIYGIEEASRTFYKKSALDLTIAESAYLAALLKAPTFYSPYGRNKEQLEGRKNLVLEEMLRNEFITKEEYDAALEEVVVFKPRENTGGIRAPHFVFYIIEQLAEKYGEEALAKGGLKVITTLDYPLQENAEEVSASFGESNQKKFNASNNAIVAMDPKTGDILAMVGSRDYFNEEISGNFNVATAHRQPGSTFKPFVYSVLFNKGYTPETILFDVPTQFSTRCAANNFTSEEGCYSPGNYDDKFRGPMTIRSALAESVNVPAVKALYLAGVRESIALAHQMGIKSLYEESRYGLSLVLGGGEVSLLDMTSAYSVFASDGIRNAHRSILRVEDQSGSILEEGDVASTRVLPEETARKINDILSDNVARTPGFGSASALYIPERPVAVKTGTSNDYKDAWIIGYTPNLAVGVWAGNNDNTSMGKKVSGLIVAPIWKSLMVKILPEFPIENFSAPEPPDPSLKHVLTGNWQRQYEEGGVHSILHWVDKDDPRGPYPSNPASDSQYSLWEYSVRGWANSNPYTPPPPLITDPSLYPPGYIPVYPVPGFDDPNTTPPPPYPNPYDPATF
ncbi:MAG: transglycosylase domain-containing protein [Parcubacteria group bacterium]